MNPKSQIRQYLIENQTGGSPEISDEESLLESGVIDSMSMVDLITYLEQTFEINVSEDDMIPENFDSVNAIANFVARQQSL